MDAIEKIRRAIAKVISPEGHTVGTAFVALPPNYLLTCWHVVENLPSVIVQFEEDKIPVSAKVIPELSNQYEDVAVLEINRPCTEWAQFGVDWKIGDNIWSYGYQYQKIVTSGYPVMGRITGSTKITNDRQLIVVSGTDFQKGLSGAPLLDQESGLVIGIIDAFIADKGVGMAIPISTVLRNWHQLARYIHQNERETISTVASLFEILGYEVETQKLIQDIPTIDIYGEMKIGFSVVRTVIDCIFTNSDVRPEDIQDFIYRVCLPLKSSSRIENAFIVSINNMLFSREALDLAKSASIRCITYRELEANLINFSRYITSYIDDFENYDDVANGQRYPIVDQIQWGDIKKYYVDLRCTDILSRDSHEENIDPYVEAWLKNKNKKHLSILGDYGTGKTSFCLHVVHKLAIQYRDDPEQSRVPLFFPLRDCNPHTSLRSFILEKLNEYHIVTNDYQAFEKMVFSGRLLLVFDGFDELAENTDEQTALIRFREISSLARGQAKIILTCRTHYFKTEEKSIDLLVPETMTPFMLELSKRDEFSIVELQGFDSNQITDFIAKHTSNPGPYWEDIKSIYNLTDLASRPILLSMIIQTLPQLKESRGKVDSTSLYNLYTKYWLEREKWRSVLTTEDKFRFTEELAWLMFTQSKLSVHHEDLLIQIQTYFAERYTSEQISQALAIDIRTSSFLSRDRSGNFAFVHKSFMEFLVGRKLAREIDDGQFDNLGIKIIPHTILNFLKDMITQYGINNLKNVAVRSDKYSPAIRGTCMDILLLLGESITSVPWIFALAFNPTSTRVATGSADCKLRIWDINAPEQPVEILASHKNWVRTVHYSPRGDFLASSGWDGCVKVWSAEDFSEIQSFQLADKVVSVSFSPDGRYLIAGGFNKSIHVWNTDTWELLRVLKEHYGIVWDVCFSPDGKHIASSCTDGAVRIWNFETGALEFVLRAHNDGVSSVCFSTNGSILFSGDWQGNVIAWDWFSRTILYRLTAHTSMIGEIHVHPKGGYFATCGDDLKVKVWECNSGNLVHVFSEPTDFLPAVQFNPDGQILACAGYDKILRLYSTSNWSSLMTIDHSTEPSP